MNFASAHRRVYESVLDSRLDIGVNGAPRYGIDQLHSVADSENGGAALHVFGEKEPIGLGT